MIKTHFDALAFTVIVNFVNTYWSPITKFRAAGKEEKKHYEISCQPRKKAGAKRHHVEEIPVMSLSLDHMF